MSGRKLPRTPGVIIAPEPPPKPRRSSDKGTASQKRSLAAGDSNYSQSLLKSLKDSQAQVSFVTSCIAREFQNTDSPMLHEEVDSLNKLLETIAEDNLEMIEEFLDTYFMEKNQKVNECCWDAIIELLVGLLKISLGDALIVYTCIHSLYTLSLLPNTLPVMHHLETTPVLLGVMSAYLRNPGIFEKAVLFLSKLTTVPVHDGLKIVVKENAVDILIRGLSIHEHSVSIIAPTLRCMSNTLSMIRQIAEQAKKHADVEAHPLASLQDSLLKQSTILEYMDKLARERVRTLLNRFPNDLGVQVEGHRFLNLCQHKGHQVNEMRRVSAELQMLQPRSILRRDSSPFPKRVSFVTIQVDDDSMEEEGSDVEVMSMEDEDLPSGEGEKEEEEEEEEEEKEKGEKEEEGEEEKEEKREEEEEEEEGEEEREEKEEQEEEEGEKEKIAEL